jgi:predicted signal transduction protein with EAL and GGDEF domain
MGHTAGDELLKAVAQRFQRCLGSPHTISRLSGDEFAFLLENVRDSLNVAEILNFLQKQFAISFDLRGHEMFINLSMGVAVFEPTCGSGEDLLCKADMALHEAKAQGKARHITFDDAMHAKATRRLKIESELRSAVRNGQLFLVYQPIVSTLDRHLIGFEALARWKHPEFGLISPTDFIPIAEETGDIVEIGEFVLNMACSQLAEWQKKIEKASRLQMSVNVSARQLAQGNLFEFVDQVIERTEILPSMLKLEVTETSIVDNVDRAITYLRQLRLLGVSISMDDFGTGYSSLSYLHRLPITTLKIDRSFVNNMETRRQSAEIVHTIILMAKNLGFNVIAEGVENLAQLEKLIEFGCEYAQGYFFSKPLSVMDAEAAIEKSDDDFCATFLPGRILQVDAERYLSS